MILSSGQHMFLHSVSSIISLLFSLLSMRLNKRKLLAMCVWCPFRRDEIVRALNGSMYIVRALFGSDVGRTFVRLIQNYIFISNKSTIHTQLHWDWHWCDFSSLIQSKANSVIIIISDEEKLLCERSNTMPSMLRRCELDVCVGCWTSYFC